MQFLYIIILDLDYLLIDRPLKNNRNQNFSYLRFELSKRLRLGPKLGLGIKVGFG